MNAKISLTLFAALLASTSAMADCSMEANAVAQAIAQGCTGSRVHSLKHASYLGQEGFYLTLENGCIGGLVGYSITMHPRSCMLLNASADLGE